MSLNCQMILILCQTFKIISSTSFKKHETLTKIFLIHFYMNRINNRLVFKRKDGYRIELQMTETMKLFDSTHKKNKGRNKK